MMMTYPHRAKAVHMPTHTDATHARTHTYIHTHTKYVQVLRWAFCRKQKAADCGQLVTKVVAGSDRKNTCNPVISRSALHSCKQAPNYTNSKVSELFLIFN